VGTWAERDEPVSAPTTDTRAAPRLSVVIASSNDGRLLAQCLRAIALQAVPGEVEVIVVRASNRHLSAEQQRLFGEMPSVRWIEAPANATVPQLRGLGISASRAERLALLEDDCVVNADWCHQATSVPASAVAIGGAVEPGPYERALDWAVYFAEYARFMLPVPKTPYAPLPGNNVLYSRRAILALPSEWQADFQEAFVHPAWQRDGVPTTVTDSLVVRNINSWSHSHLTSVPYHHGRAFSGRRLQGRNFITRAAFAVLTLGLPLLKVARIVSEVLRRRRFRGHLTRALPWIVIFAISWSAGEFVGALRGAGQSPLRWR
jgi:hypothetical protein